ncbi:MAG: FHA domain-containing protein [Planctomycetota bacterium]
MNASLLVVKADGTSQEIHLRHEHLVVGREKDALLRIPARSVSRQHCEFLVEDGRLTVKDLRSSNGTFVNRERVEHSALHAGDLVSIGPAVFAVILDGEPSSLDPSDVYARGSVELADDAAPAAPKSAQAAAALAGGVAGAESDGADPDDSDIALSSLSDGNDDSSLLDFDFDLGEDDDEDDEQPGL